MASPDTSADTPVALAAEALRLATTDIRRARAVATRALTAAADAGDRGAAAAVAERALGLACREQGDVDASVTHFRRSIRAAEAAGLAVHAAEARISLSTTLAHQGHWARAIRELDRAELGVSGLDLARVQAQRAFILMLQGRPDEALAGFRRALPVLRRSGDRLWEARVYTNRGLTHLHKGALAAAEADLLQAEELYLELGQRRMAASARHNLGLVLGRRGDIAHALSSFDAADAYFREQGLVDPKGLTDRAFALLDARLGSEARHAAERAVEALRSDGQDGYLAIARWTLAEAALLEGDSEAAKTASAQAARAFARQGRPGWAALSRHVGVRAAWLGGDRSRELLLAARRSAEALTSAGFVIPALDARLFVAQMALDMGRPEMARRQLGKAPRARRRGPVQIRARAWHVEALIRLADGNRRGAEAALRAGMDMVERYRAVLGATELRSAASGHVAELARLGLRLALEDGNAERTLAWAERWRAGTLRLRPARVPDDDQLATDLAELRTVVAGFDEATLANRPTTRLLQRQATLEEAVRGRARHATGVLAAALHPRPRLSTLRDALGPNVLVEMMEDGGNLYAVVVAAGRAHLRKLASSAEVAAEQERLAFSLRRLARQHGSEASQVAAADAAAYGAGRLDTLLFGPIRPFLAGETLVIVPSGALHALPWATLPSCAGTPLVIAPSAAVWHRAETSAPSAADSSESGTVLVAGPGLPAAVEEVEALAVQQPDARLLSGERATCAAVCDAFAGARLAHVAAHGRFRADNPMFSCLTLADGPLTVYDLECLPRPPRTLILSACDSGLSDVRPGDELMGLVAALLALGTRTVVGSVYAVPDDATRVLMLALHAGLAAGLPTAAALAAAQSSSAAAGPTGLAAAAAFACFGSGT